MGALEGWPALSVRKILRQEWRQRILCSDPFKQTIWTTGCGGCGGVACCDRGEDPKFVEQQELIQANYHYYL
jgi:hypothetical protein